jgi:hypothetical protein
MKRWHFDFIMLAAFIVGLAALSAVVILIIGAILIAIL